jgi:hypothetical protein
MKASKLILLAALAAFFLVLPGCGQDKEEQRSVEIKPKEPPPEVVTIKGKVLEIVDEGGKFIYILLDRGEKQTWATMPAVDVAVGEDVALIYANVFQNFYSKSLKRSFDELIFSSGIEGRPPRARTGFAKQQPAESPDQQKQPPSTIQQ